MPGTEQQMDASVRVRLTPAQIKIIAPALSLLVSSYEERKKAGTSRLAYPFSTLPPPRGFDRGTYNQTFMDKILAIWKTFNARSPNGHSVQMDAIQIRAAIFATRANVQYARLLRRQERRKRRLEKARLQLMGEDWSQFIDPAWLQVKGEAKLQFDDKYIARLKARSQFVIRTLDRHSKRANRASMKVMGKEGYEALLAAWKMHLRWMRLHIAYFKSRCKPVLGLRKRQQNDIDVLVEMAKRGLRELRYQQPDDDELRRVIRLYAKYAHNGRQGDWTVHFLVENKKSHHSAYHLAHFVIDHLNLKELSKS